MKNFGGFFLESSASRRVEESLEASKRKVKDTFETIASPDGDRVDEQKGLGLRIASLLAEELGGRLRFEGGEGTTAVVSFRESEG